MEDPMSETALAAIDIMNGQVMENFFEKWGSSYVEDLMDEWNDGGAPTEDDQVDGTDEYDDKFKDAILVACRDALKNILFDVKFKPNTYASRTKDPKWSVAKVGAYRHEAEAKIYDTILYCMWDTFQEYDEEVEDEEEETHEVVYWLQKYLEQNPRFQDDVVNKIMDDWAGAICRYGGDTSNEEEE